MLRERACLQHVLNGVQNDRHVCLIIVLYFYKDSMAIHTGIVKLGI